MERVLVDGAIAPLRHAIGAFMAAETVDLLVLPHLDRHVVFSGGLPALKLEAKRCTVDFDLPSAPKTHTLASVAIASTVFRFFGPTRGGDAA